MEPTASLTVLKKRFRRIKSVSLTVPVIGLFKTEVIRPQGPWKNVEEVEFATLTWVDWFNNRRLLEPIGDRPPAEKENEYYRQLGESARAA